MLGMLARNYSDQDMREILATLQGIAEEGFELYRDFGQTGDPSDD